MFSCCCVQDRIPYCLSTDIKMISFKIENKMDSMDQGINTFCSPSRRIVSREFDEEIDKVDKNRLL